jgi:hypothetical protein
VRRLLVTANVVPSSQILVTLMMKALSSSETSVFTRATRLNTPYDAIFHSHRRENLKSYISMDLLIADIHYHYSCGLTLAVSCTKLKLERLTLI